MIAVDSNLLVYAHREDSPWHERSSSVIGELASAGQAWALPWPCLHEFLAIVTHPRIYDPPSSVHEALTQVEAWLEAPHVTLLGESPGYLPHLRHQLERSRAAGPQVHDARIAALCVFHGVRELWSADRDFSRFPDLRVRNPLVA